MLGRSERGGKRVAVFHPTHYLGSSVVGYVAGYVWEHAGWLPLMVVLAALFVIAAWRVRSL